MKVLAAAALVACLVRPVAAQDATLVVITGVEGDAEHGARFRKWGGALVDAAKDRYKVPATQIVYLADKPDQDPRVTGRSTREEVERAIKALAGRAQPGDQVFIVLFGHGSFDGSQSRFNLPGQDLTEADWGRLIDVLSAQRVVLVNTTASSGGFVQALSKPGRTIVAATKTGGERNETRFPEYFVEALTGDAADLDKDGRVSVLEAFVFARSKVLEVYEKEGLLLSEHAVLDDNGDKEGTGEFGPKAVDGKVASTLSLASRPGSSAPAGADAALRALYDERRALEGRIDALRAMKGGMDAARYEQDLERLLTELALKTRAIREREGRP